MPWTTQDFEDVEAAIRDVRDGKRKASQQSESSGQSFMNTSLPDLIKLRDAIRLEVGDTPTATGLPRRPRLFLTRHKRGL